MKVFVINLARSTERRQLMTEKMAVAGVEFEFFDAVDAAVPDFSLSERAAPEITLKLKGYTLLSSEVACYASHYLMWEKCIELGESIVVLEDNIDVSGDFKQVIDALLNKTKSYDYIKLSATLNGRKFKALEPICSDTKLGIYNKGTSGATGYVITPKAARAFMDASAKFIFPCDDLMEKPWLHRIQAYSVYPSICWRANIVSTIGNNRKNKQHLGFINKLSVELFRVYESVMKNISWKY
ncbi:glycosyltransferase family 25 protein [Shewanella sp. SNU WT4]|uniref:glycosyltransferase family 25 protein n=1 Tax=Shewanella sp. SNU WT4 TaxID=2590015 RepID=UPI00112D8DE3|nr:glycosyltransferase family 25 protein [Shewanella sp. SNU WT4]QDF65626.1 glycosyltransferase family 25 protein [Shewanella sp. SNU WT4]